MKKKVYSAIILLSLAAPALVIAAEANNTEVHGTVELGAMGVNSNGDEARFNEFRDLDDSVIGSMQLDAFKGTYHFQLDGKNIGRDDQSFQFKGGEYGNFKYKFHYDEMPHNYTFDAITPFSGVGTSNIAFVDADPSDSIANWTKFDYAVDHKSYGGELEISLGSPFYVNFGAEKREQDGLRPYAVLTYRAPFGTRQLAEFPEPISHTTDNLHLKGGYLGESITASLSGVLSSFKNDIKHFQGISPTGGSVVANDDNVVLAPDNDYMKIAGDLTWRRLPLSSVLAASLSYANLENDFTAADIYGANAAAILADSPFSGNLNRTNFEGDIDYTNFSLALSSQPLDKLDTKIFYNYLDRDDKSSRIFYNATSGDNAKELLSYEKNTFGIDFGYRLPNKTKLEAGYEYLDMDRSTAAQAYTAAAANFYRYDNPESTTDDTLYVGLKNNYLDWLTAKIKYTTLERDSDINTAAAVANGVDPRIYTTRFDAQDKTMDEWKLAFEFYPMDQLDLALDFNYQRHDYDENISSRTDEKRQSVYADVTWRATQTVALGAFVGFEKTEIEAYKRSDESEFVADRIESTDDDFWTYGLTARIKANERLSFDASWQYEDSDGSIDFTDLGVGAQENIGDFDDYTKERLEAKAIYAIDPKLEMTLGYVYEKLEYQDYAMANYANIVTDTTFDSYSGLYANPNYEANIGYLMVKYGF